MVGKRRLIWLWLVGVVAVLGTAALLLLPASKASGVSEANAAHAPVLAPLPSDPVAINRRSILVIGGTSGVGLETVKLALARGHIVTVMARHLPATPLQEKNLAYVQGDIASESDVRRAIGRGQDAIVTAIGIPPTFKPVTVFSVGAENVLGNMLHSKRLIAVTGIGAGESRGHGGFAYDHITEPLLLKYMYADKDREETAIRGSSVDWTIVRPGFLTNATAAHKYWVVHDVGETKSGAIARADVAHYIVAIIESGEDSRQAVILTN